MLHAMIWTQTARAPGLSIEPDLPMLATTPIAMADNSRAPYCLLIVLKTNREMLEKLRLSD